MSEQVKYHLTNDGPKVCVASVRKCKLAHFEDFDVARKEYEKVMSHRETVSKKRRSYAPPKPELILPDKIEVENALAKLRTSESNVGRVLQGNPVAYALMGSAMYGLNTPESDRDLVIFTDVKSKKDVHKVDKETGEDIRVASIYALGDRLLEGDPNHVDMVHSPIFRISDNYAPYVRGIRFDHYQYLNRNEAHIVRDVDNAVKDTELNHNIRRAAKSLKMGLRTAILQSRVLNDGDNYKVDFTRSEREQFYRKLNKLQTSFGRVDRNEMLNMIYDEVGINHIARWS